MATTSGGPSISDCVAGGYFLTKPAWRPSYSDATLLPRAIVSLSDCITSFVPDIWAIRWAQVPDSERREEAARAGIEAERVEAAIARVTTDLDAGRFGWPSVFSTVSSAQSFYQEFLPGNESLLLLGAGLPREFVPAFLDRGRPAPDQAPPGVYLCVGQQSPMAEGGEALGWEVLGYEPCGQFHSWLCHGLEVDGFEKLSIQPGDLGMIGSYAEAKAAAEYCGRDEVAAEPVPWFPWLIVRYPLALQG